jgi:hypothetical protein
MSLSLYSFRHSPNTLFNLNRSSGQVLVETLFSEVISWTSSGNPSMSFSGNFYR